MVKHDLPQEILEYLRQQLAVGVDKCRAEDITDNVNASRPTVSRYLVKMAASGEILKLGGGPTTRYALPAGVAAVAPAGQVEQAPQPIAPLGGGFQFSEERKGLIAQLRAPIGTRKPVSYQRAFVDNYVPNQSSLIPPALAEDLFAKGRARGQQPAGTYARKMLEQLLIDLSWHSSRLEGNRKSLLDTKEIFAKGHADENDVDAAFSESFEADK